MVLKCARHHHASRTLTYQLTNGKARKVTGQWCARQTDHCGSGYEYPILRAKMQQPPRYHERKYHSWKKCSHTDTKPFGRQNQYAGSLAGYKYERNSRQ